MTCAKISELLTDYIMGELPSDLNKVVQEHLQNCTACGNEHQALKKIISELHGLAQNIEPPEYLSNQLEQMLVAEIATSKKSKKWRQPKFIGQIAAVFLMVAIGWGIWGNPMGINDDNKELAKEETPAAVVLDQREQQNQDTVTQDVQLPQPKVAGESVPMAMNPKSESKSEPKIESAKEVVTETTKSTAPPEIANVDILRTDMPRESEQQLKLFVAQSRVDLETVQQVNVITADEDDEEKGDQIITPKDNLDTIAMIVQGINEALPSDDTVLEDEVTHIINIQLDNGDNYQLNYCLPKNIGFVEDITDGETFTPGASLSLALENL
ncbi:zf-HC2 domain-containing protein [Peptococcaceae bacterium 1198_IL3148]